MKAGNYIWVHFPHFLMDLAEIRNLGSLWPGLEAQGVKFPVTSGLDRKWPEIRVA